MIQENKLDKVFGHHLAVLPGSFFFWGNYYNILFTIWSDHCVNWFFRFIYLDQCVCRFR